MALDTTNFEKLKKQLQGQQIAQAIQKESLDSVGVPEILQKRFGEASTQLKESAKTGFQVNTPTNIVTGQGAGAINDIIGMALDPVFKPVLEKISETDIGKKAFSSISQGVEKYNEFKQSSPVAKQIANSLENMLNVAGLYPGAKATSASSEAIQSTAKGVTKKILTSVEPPLPKPMEAVGQVLQGETKDIKSGVKSLATLDTTGVSTFNDLGKKIKEKISTLGEQVDLDLAKDQTKTKIDDLVIKQKSNLGKEVAVNPVDDAIRHLSELYTKIGDKVQSQNMIELLETAKTSGLTKQEINDIARIYGQEFGDKAFSKIGEPLTSVNAQMYENTRKQLKDLARSGITGSEAKAADEAMSNLYNTQRLIKKNIEAVNKIKQKITERGLLEKIGYNVTKYADILTGGSLRGVVGGLLPRGVGYKVMNALDIEKALSKNLKVLQDAIKSKSDKEIEKILKDFKF